MTNNIAMVPTLGSQTFLTDIPQILSYQLRQYITMPKSRSDVYSDQIISIMDDISSLSYDKEGLSKLVEDHLSAMYNRIFENTNIDISVLCSTDTMKGSKYQLNILVEATDGETSWSLAPSIVNNNGILTIKNDTVSVQSIQ